MEIQASVSEELATKDKEADKIIRNHVLGAMGVGLIPIPMVDLVALTGVHLNLLRRISKTYDIPFSKDKGKSIISSLLGGGLSLPLGATVSSLLKAIPGVGQAFGVIGMPVAAGSVTYAVGKVFVQHFASGGTFLNFNPEEVKAYFEEMLKEGEKIAAELKESTKAEVKESTKAEVKESTKAEVKESTKAEVKEDKVSEPEVKESSDKAVEAEKKGDKDPDTEPKEDEKSAKSSKKKKKGSEKEDGKKSDWWKKS
ncbi:DUF697 domain-containing protein [Desulfococcaceae bacterium HSG8]|nr:DUF697 domain-containing protein [Desulfococcaceae bacterium HSG8]